MNFKKKKRHVSKHVHLLKSINFGKVKTNSPEFIFKDNHKKIISNFKKLRSHLGASQQRDG